MSKRRIIFIMTKIVIHCIAIFYVLAGLQSAHATMAADKKSMYRQSAIAEIPIDFVNNRVQVVLTAGPDNTPLTFLLDTGATSSVFFQSAQLDAVPMAFSGSSKLSFPAIDAKVTGSRIISVPLHFGDFTFESKRGIYIPANEQVSTQLRIEYDAILGREFFEAFTVEIDPADKMMYLYKAGTDLRGNFVVSQRIYLEGRTPHIQFVSQMPWERRSSKKTMLLDTGYPGSLVIWNKKHFLQASNAGKVLERGINSTGIVSFIDLTFGKLYFEHIPVFIAGKVPAQAQKRDGLIGASLVSQYHHAFDFTNGRLLLSPVIGRDGQAVQVIDGLIYTPAEEAFDLKAYHPAVPSYPILTVRVRPKDSKKALGTER